MSMLPTSASGFSIRAATTMAKNPQIRFPSVNSVGKTAMVRMGRIGDGNVECRNQDAECHAILRSSRPPPPPCASLYRAMTVVPAMIRWPSSTSIADRRSSGMINSVREPSLIMPNFCPRPTISPGRRSQTIRRAMAPEICRTTSRRCGGDSSSRADPRVLVAPGTLRIQGVEKLARRVSQGNHPRLGRGTVQVYVEDRQEDADPHGRAADELVVLQPRDLDHFAVGRRDQQTRPRPESARGGSRKKVDDQAQRAPPAVAPGYQSRCQASKHGERQQRPAHQLQFGQAPAGKRQPVAPAERVVGRVPIAPAAVAAVFQVAGIEDFVRRPGRVAASQGRHAADVAGPKPLQPPPPPAAPGHLDPVANPTPRLHGHEIVRQRLRFAAR